ncbi:fibronectin type III domain protein [Opisthorchis viverrini]|uniref:Fibronectin type III domain protein n=1 Tax=Opisthorchis viverrini TaxID=6198 RepID=A0A1S8X0R1_OPIVI|nr:fibronectin type III domain protein [Opisthorchis viverrini]
MGRSIEIANLPLCETIQIGVMGRNRIGTGSQVKSSAITIAAVPSPPKSVRVIAVPNSVNAIVLWEYDGECMTNDFQVTVYQSDGTSMKTLDTVPRSAELTDLPLCKPLTVGVLGRNQVGSGPQTKSLEFSIPGAPTVPTAIQVKKTNNVPSATVSWEYDGACSATNFQVIINKPDGSSVESVVRTERKVDVPGLPMCVPLVARVRARNEVADGPQANSEQFTIPAGNMSVYHPPKDSSDAHSRWRRSVSQ